jgi:hypothetical protein
MREGATSRVMAADRPYGDFYDLYSVGPEYFGYNHVFRRFKELEYLIIIPLYDKRSSTNYRNVFCVKYTSNSRQCLFPSCLITFLRPSLLLTV